MVDIDTKLWRSFLTVASERSFSRAANRLGCSQTTMSQRVQHLESLLGVELFRREYHDITLSPAGLDLRDEAQALVDAHDLLVARIARDRVHGSVRLGIAEDYVLPMLPRLLRAAQVTLPGVEISVLTGLSAVLCRQIEARTLDMAVVTLPLAAPSVRTLSEPPLHWVAAPDFRMASDAILPLALFPEGCAFRAVALARLAEASMSHRIVLESASGQVIQAAVAAGVAVTVMAGGTIPQDLRPLNGCGLPDLPATRMQIVERAHGLSVAAKAVRSLVEGLW